MRAPVCEARALCGSTEELTPVRCDRISAVPLAHHLDLKSIRLIEREEFG
jgi:hypothetical protein